MNSTRGANNLGHALFNNLRDGDWMLDYISNRLINNYTTKKLGVWLQRVFDTLKKVTTSLFSRVFLDMVYRLPRSYSFSILFSMLRYRAIWFRVISTPFSLEWRKWFSMRSGLEWGRIYPRGPCSSRKSRLVSTMPRNDHRLKSRMLCRNS